MKRVVKRIVIGLVCVFLALLLVVVGYLAYVLLSYSRIEDNLSLQVNASAQAESEAKKGKTYTVFTQNLGFGAYTADFTFFMDGGKESRARSKESVLSCIRAGAEKAKEYSPDFIFFQEVDTDSTRSFHTDQREMLVGEFFAYANAFAVNYHSAYLMYPIFQPHGASNSGMLTLSSVNMTSSIRRSLPISTGFSKFLDLDRCYCVSRVPVEDGKELVLYNVHTSAYGGSDRIRHDQMTMLFSDMKAEYDKGNYCICGGDFNHDFTGDSATVLNGMTAEEQTFGWAQPFPADLLPEGISRVTDYACGEQRPTCRDCDVPYREGNKVFIVDGFLVSDNVSVSYVENIQTGFAYSDHNPVVMQFSL